MKFDVQHSEYRIIVPNNSVSSFYGNFSKPAVTGFKPVRDLFTEMNHNRVLILHTAPHRCGLPMPNKRSTQLNHGNTNIMK